MGIVISLLVVAVVFLCFFIIYLTEGRIRNKSALTVYDHQPPCGSWVRLIPPKKDKSQERKGRVE